MAKKRLRRPDPFEVSPYRDVVCPACTAVEGISCRDFEDEDPDRIFPVADHPERIEAWQQANPDTAQKLSAKKRGRASQAKGKRFERQIVKELQELGLSARRVPQNEPGHNNPDVQTGMFNIECKHHKSRINVRKVLDQMAQINDPSRISVGVIKDQAPPGQRPRVFAVTSWDDMKALINEVEK